MAADLGESLDPEASYQIRRKTYVDDGAGGGSRSQVERFRGELIDGEYSGTLAQIFRLVNLRLKVMVASGDTDMNKIEILGEKVLGHIWRPTEDKLVFVIKVNLTPAKFKRSSGTQHDDLTVSDIPRLLGMTITKRGLLGFVNSQYDHMGLVCPFSNYP